MTVQDRIDGGITILMRCPGYTSVDLTVEDITLDVYITPREILQTKDEMSKHIAILAQNFAQNIVIPHLYRFAERCHTEKVVPLQCPRKSGIGILRCLYLQPVPAFGSQPKKQGAHILPPFYPPGSCHMRYRCLSTESLTEGEGSYDEQWWAEACVAADKYESEMTASTTIPNTPNDAHRQPTVAIPSNPCDEFRGAIVSLGPHTDIVLDRFNLNDTLVPRLRTLSTTVRSSKWEATLRSAQWGLSHDQAANLSSAMIADIKNEQFVRIKVHSYVHFCPISTFIDRYPPAQWYIRFQMSPILLAVQFGVPDSDFSLARDVN
jgi:hypothetical protein